MSQTFKLKLPHTASKGISPFGGTESSAAVYYSIWNADKSSEDDHHHHHDAGDPNDDVETDDEDGEELQSNYDMKEVATQKRQQYVQAYRLNGTKSENSFA